MTLSLYDTKTATRQRRADAQQREQDRIAARRAELEGTSITAIRDAEVRPLSEAKRALDENFKNLVKTLRSNVLEVPEDYDIQDPEPLKLVNLRDLAAIKRQSQIAYEAFVRMHPEGSECPWYRCDENVRAIETYFGVNGVKVQSADMLSKAWCRLTAFGLTKKKPAPTPALEKKLSYTPLPVPEGEHGYSLETGEPEFLTTRQVDNLSSDDYRRWKNGIKTNFAEILQRP